MDINIDVFKKEEVNKILKNGQVGYCSSLSKYMENKVLGSVERYLNLEKAIDLKDVVLLPTNPMKIMYIYVKLNDTIIFDIVEGEFDLGSNYLLEYLRINE